MGYSYNDGQGGLSLNASFGNEQADTYAISLGDVNGDGLIDIVTANSGDLNMLFYHLKPRD